MKGDDMKQNGPQSQQNGSKDTGAPENHKAAVGNSKNDALPSSVNLKPQRGQSQSGKDSGFSQFELAFPSELRNCELNMLSHRRKTAEIPGSNDVLDPRDTVGLALSGGGIRSATFGLGLLQALAHCDILKHIDYLSTVSGGGYIGSFWGALHCPRDVNPDTGRTEPASTLPQSVRRILVGHDLSSHDKRNSHWEPLQWLRNNGRYMTPGGSGDALLLGTIALRNWAAVQSVSLISLLTLFLLLRFLTPPSSVFEWSPVTGCIPYLLTLWTLPAAWAYWLVCRKEGPTKKSLISRDLNSTRGKALAFMNSIRHVTSIMNLIPLFTTLAALLISFFLLKWPKSLTFFSNPDLAKQDMKGFIFFLLFITSAVAILFWAWTIFRSACSCANPSEQDSIPIRFAQCWLNQACRRSLLALLLVSGLGIADSGGRWLYTRVSAPVRQAQSQKEESTKWNMAIDIRLSREKPNGIVPDSKEKKLLLDSKIIEPVQTVSSGPDEPSPWEKFMAVLGAIVTTLTALASASSKVRQLFVEKKDRPSWARTLGTLAVSLLAIMVAVGSLVGLSFLSYAMFHAGSPLPTQEVWRQASDSISESWRQIPSYALQELGKLLAPIALLLTGIALSLSIGRNFCFINSSGIGSHYTSMLTRAYLGASNRARFAHNSPSTRSSEDRNRQKPAQKEWNISNRPWEQDGDDLSLAEYHPEKSGGPLHIINVTVNETVGADSQIVLRDRKGIPLAVGPAGMSLGVRHHALWGHECKAWTELKAVRRNARSISEVFSRFLPFLSDQIQLHSHSLVSLEEKADIFPVFQSDGGAFCQPDPLTLGKWVGISGAAFTTGMGFQTSPSRAFLMGLLNIRLGFWWNSGTGITPGGRRPMLNFWQRWFPAQFALSRELLARFHGPQGKHWYLSDGGHFENTGAYELIRRRVGLILLSDAGCDRNHEFEDLANLVEKVRVDFGAEIVFLDKNQLETMFAKAGLQNSGFGTLQELRGPGKSNRADPQSASVKLQAPPLAPPQDCPWEGNRVHCAIARVSYPDTHFSSILLLIKPSLCSDMPEDVLHYARDHADFPQVSTLDQFFDEKQWESYRKLGEHIGRELFDTEKPPFKPLAKMPDSRKTCERWLSFRKLMSSLGET